MSDKFKVAAIQMVSEPEVEANLEAARRLIAEAARQGARLASLPEYFCIFGRRERDKVEVRERDGSGPIQQFLSDTSREYGMWIVGGSVPLESSDPGKVDEQLPGVQRAGRARGPLRQDPSVRLLPRKPSAIRNPAPSSRGPRRWRPARRSAA